MQWWRLNRGMGVIGYVNQKLSLHLKSVRYIDNDFCVFCLNHISGMFNYNRINYGLTIQFRVCQVVWPNARRNAPPLVGIVEFYQIYEYIVHDVAPSNCSRCPLSIPIGRTSKRGAAHKSCRCWWHVRRDYRERFHHKAPERCICKLHRLHYETLYIAPVTTHKQLDFNHDLRACGTTLDEMRLAPAIWRVLLHVLTGDVSLWCDAFNIYYI